MCGSLTGETCSNYGFFNGLTIMLSVTLVDDSWWPAALVRSVRSEGPAPLATGWLLSLVGIVWTPLSIVLVTAFAGLILFSSLEPLVSLSRNQFRLLRPLEGLYAGTLPLAPWRAIIPPAILSLFRVVPFATQPPKYIKVELWQYYFASLAHLRETGCYWRRTYKRPLNGIVLLDPTNKDELALLPPRL